MCFRKAKTYPGDVAPLRRFENVSPGFLHTTGARLIAGRELRGRISTISDPMVMISGNLAREFWGARLAALGKRLRQYPHTPWQEVIGVVEDVRQNGIQEKAPEIVYWPVFERNPLLPITARCDARGDIRDPQRACRHGEAF